MEKVKLFLVLGAALCLLIATRIVPASAQQIDSHSIADTRHAVQVSGQSPAGRARRKVSADQATPAARG